MIPYSKLRKDVDRFFDKPDTLTVYIYLLVSAGYKAGFYERGGFALKKDQVVKSIGRISTDLSLTEGKVKLALKRLESSGFIVIDRSRHINVITVLSPDSGDSLKPERELDF